jgi:V8-like Glu-specific endopeptidase
MAPVNATAYPAVVSAMARRRSTAALLCGTSLLMAGTAAAQPSPAAVPVSCEQVSERVIWPSATSSSDTRIVSRLTQSARQQNYCVLEVSDNFTARRVRYDLNVSANWAWLSYHPDDTTTATLRVPAAGKGSLNQASDQMQQQLSEWLRDRTATAGQTFDATIGPLLFSAAAQPARAKRQRFWTAIGSRNNHHLLVAPVNASCNEIQLTRGAVDCSNPGEEPLVSDGHSLLVPARQQAQDNFVAPLAEHTVRIQFRSGGSVLPCSGYLLGPREVLTAKHCVTSSNASEDCLNNVRACSSYVVDVDYRSDHDPLESVGVVQATSRGKLDFAFLHLDADIPLPPTRAALADPPQMAVQKRQQVLLGHPNGIPLFESDCVEELGLPGPRAFHQCYTEEGSSGALLWRRGGQRPVPTVLHTNAFRPCSVTPEAESPGNNIDLLAEEVDDAAAELKLRDRPCVGYGVKMLSIYSDLCTGGSASTADGDCATFKQLLDGTDAPTLSSTPSATVTTGGQP